MKAFAGRAQDWAAVEGILIRQRDHLDWTYVDRHLPALCDMKGEPEAVAELARLRERVREGP